VKYVEGSLPESAALASLLDQQALVHFLAGKLPEAEAAAARMLAAAQRLFAEEEAAIAMCSLRLGTALAGAPPHLGIELHAISQNDGACGVYCCHPFLVPVRMHETRKLIDGLCAMLLMRDLSWPGWKHWTAFQQLTEANVMIICRSGPMGGSKAVAGGGGYCAAGGVWGWL